MAADLTPCVLLCGQVRLLQGELARLSLLWEEAWHATLSELQVTPVVLGLKILLSPALHPLSPSTAASIDTCCFVFQQRVGSGEPAELLPQVLAPASIAEGVPVT